MALISVPKQSLIPSTDLVNEAQAEQQATQKPKAEAQQTDHLDLWNAAFQNENILSSMVGRSYSPNSKFDPAFNPFEGEYLKGYEQFADRFTKSRNKEDADTIKSNIDREVRNKKLVDEGGAEGVLASVVASIADPITLAGLLVAPEALVGKTVLTTAAKSSGFAAADQLSRETLLHPTQETRTFEQSATNILAATLLGGTLGGGIKALTPEARTQLQQQVAQDLSQQIPDAPLPKDQNLGAAKVVSTTMDQELLPTIEKIIGKTGFTPNERLATSPSLSVRQLKDELSNDALRRNKHYEGIASPQNVEVEINRRVTELVGTTVEAVNHNAPKVFGMSDHVPQGDVLAEELIRAGERVDRAAVIANPDKFWTPYYFKSLVSGALRNGDDSAIAQVKGVAQTIRSKVIDPLKTEANDLGMFNDMIESAAKREAQRAATTGPLPNEIAAIKADLSAAKEAVANAKATNLTKSEITKLKSDVKNLTLKLDKREADLANLVKTVEETARKIALDPKTSQTYLHRVWDKNRLEARPVEFKQRIADWVVRTQPDLSNEAKIIAQDVYDSIVGTQRVALAHELDLVGKAGPLKERLLMIPDNEISDFLENDIEKVMSRYVRSMVNDVTFKTHFGDKNLTDFVSKIGDDYHKLQEAISAEMKASNATDKEIESALQALAKRHKDDLSDLMWTRDMILGNVHNDVNTWTRASATVKKLNVARQLGGIVLSSLPDIGRLVWANGLGRFSKAISSLATNQEFRKLSAEEAKRLGYGFEYALQNRFQSIGDFTLDQQLARATTVEKAANYVASNFGRLTGFAYWNQFGKHVAGVLHSDKLIEAATRYGTLDKDTVAWMAQHGVDDLMAQRIAQQFSDHGELVNGFRHANTGEWTDQIAREAFSNAVFKAVNHTIATPDAGSVPRWFRGPVGSVLAQFRTFVMTAHEQVILAGLQERNANALMGGLTMASAGAIAYNLKQLAAGREMETNPAKLTYHAVEVSGLGDLFSEVDNLAYTIGAPSMKGALRIEPKDNFRGRSAFELVGGPTTGMVADLSKITGDALSGDWDSGTTHKVRRLLPFQNVFYIRRALDEAEKQMKSTFGDQ